MEKKQILLESTNRQKEPRQEDSMSMLNHIFTVVTM